MEGYMKKFIIQFTICLLLLLCIPFSTFAKQYNDPITDFPNITKVQLDKIQELYNSSDFHSNLVIFYGTSNLLWSYDITNYNSSTGSITVSQRFQMTPNGNITTISGNYSFGLNGANNVLYFSFNNSIIFENQYLNKTNTSDNYLLFNVTNTVTNTVNGCTISPNGQYYYGDVTVYYDSIIDITGYNFDVYYLVDNTYRLIQENINSFQILESHSVYKKQSSGNNSSCIYPSVPSIPKDSVSTYKSSFKYNYFYFVINDEIDLNTILVKAPETDSLLSDGNSNSQSTTSNNNQSNQVLDNTVNQMESLENGFKNDLNSNLDNINANDFNISGITQLSNAANFVRVQFDNLTKNNPFGTILGFSLFLGLSLLIIGKRL